MRLVVDANVLIAELLRVRGRALVARPDLELFQAARAFDETEHEMRRRVAIIARQGSLLPDEAAQLLTDALTVRDRAVRLVPLDIYADSMPEARRRIPRDPDDAPTVALALRLRCGIWTSDTDFFGCGLPVWTTETLLSYLDTLEQDA